MNGKPETEMTLTRIRNCYRNIQLLTLDCLSENIPEHIPQLLCNREEILNVISSEEEKIACENYSEEPLSAMRREIESIINSIRIADQQLSAVIRGNLDSLSHAMTKHYQKSRAVSAYAGQSRG